MTPASCRIDPLDVRNTGEAEAVMGSRFCAIDFRKNRYGRDGNFARFEGVELPDVKIYKIDFLGSAQACRTREHIVADSARDFLVSIPLHEQSVVVRGGHKTYCRPGYFRLLATSLPYRTQIAGAHAADRHSSLHLRVSGSLLRDAIPTIDDCSDQVLEILPGAGKVMKSLIETGLTEGHALSALHAASFGKAIVEAIANAILAAPDSGASRMATSSAERVLEAAKQFILRNLAHPDLDCAMVAGHCQVSKAYMHRVFAESAFTVGNYIRESRLQRCREALHNRAMRHHSILEIASNWGFDNQASFSRTYKARYGTTPREERNASR